MSAQIGKDAENLWVTLVFGISQSVSDKQLRLVMQLLQGIEKIRVSKEYVNLRSR